SSIRDLSGPTLGGGWLGIQPGATGPQPTLEPSSFRYPSSLGAEPPHIAERCPAVWRPSGGPSATTGPRATTAWENDRQLDDRHLHAGGMPSAFAGPCPLC